MKRKHQIQPGFEVIPVNVKTGIKVKDLRDLVLWIGSEQGPPAPTWLTVKNKSGIEHIVSILVPGLARSDFIPDLETKMPLLFHSKNLPALQAFKYAWPTTAPGTHDRLESAVGEFTRVPLTKTERKRQERERQQREAKEGVKGATLDELVLSAEKLKALGYPLELADGWTEATLENETPRVFAIDCEMCESAKGQVLARVSVVGTDEKEVYESYVQPDEVITDYVTRYSGITPELLEGVTTTLKDVQKWFQENIAVNDYLVGHSLDCDLKVLKFVHKKIIDTAAAYRHPRGPPMRPSLKWLAQKYLDKTIQNSDQGHDSAEDARTCIQLLALKQEKGLEFGCRQMTVSLTEKLKEAGKRAAIIDYGSSHWDGGHAQTIVSCSSDAEVASTVASLSKSHFYTFACLKELERAHGWYKDAPEVDMDLVFAELNKNLTTILEGVPPKTAIILWSGNSDPRAMSKLLQRKRQFKADYQTKKWDEIEQPWTETDDKALAAALGEARAGVSFMTVTDPAPLDLEPPKKVANTGSAIIDSST